MESMVEAIEAIRKAILHHPKLWNKLSPDSVYLWYKGSSSDCIILGQTQANMNLNNPDSGRYVALNSATEHLKELLGLIDAYNYIIYGKAKRSV